MSIRRRAWVTPSGESRSAWIVDYRDRDGQRHITSFEHKKDAAAYDAETRAAIRRGTHTAPSRSPTVIEAVADWVERGEIEQLERATLKQYRELGAHIEHHLGATRLAVLTTPGVNAFRDVLCRTMSRSMARKVLTALKGVLGEAQRRGNVAQNVAIGVRIGPDKARPASRWAATSPPPTRSGASS